MQESINEGSTVYLYNNAFKESAHDYFRIDIGFSYRKNNPTWTWIISVDIQNLTNRANIWDSYFDPESNKLKEIYMVGLIPVLNYKVQF